MLMKLTPSFDRNGAKSQHESLARDRGNRLSMRWQPKIKAERSNEVHEEKKIIFTNHFDVKFTKKLAYFNKEEKIICQMKRYKFLEQFQTDSY